MKPSQRMRKIAEINTGYENIAGAALASAQTHHQQQLKQLEQLKEYKQEYQAKLSSRMSSAITPKAIQDFQAFLLSLDDAISHQANMVNNSINQVDLSRENWLKKKQDVSKISKVAENLFRKETIKAEKQEQNSADELNQIFFEIEKKKNDVK